MSSYQAPDLRELDLFTFMLYAERHIRTKAHPHQGIARYEMTFSVLRPELLNILDAASGQTCFGGDQEWYLDEWNQRAGCGPTCAANLTAYLALTRPELRALYAGEDMGKAAFSAHMEDVYKYVTPGGMGLNRLEMFTDGIEDFARSRGRSLRAHVFEVHGNMHRGRPQVRELADFVRAGLESDCPVAFLNLTKGRVKNLQGWHWVTITGADVDDEHLTASASDEGRLIHFDLRLWYLSTRMRGGLVYFTEDQDAPVET
jgi:hypothetical protein